MSLTLLPPDSPPPHNPDLPASHSDDLPASQPDSQTVLQLESESTLRDYVDRVLPQADDRVRARTAGFLWDTCHGVKCRDALKRQDMTWTDVMVTRAKWPIITQIYKVCVEMGDEVRQQIREETADERGIEGWLEPVFWKGVEMGTIRRYSEKLLMMMMKAGNPEKFADHQKTESTVRSISMNFNFDPDQSAAELDRYRTERNTPK